MINQHEAEILRAVVAQIKPKQLDMNTFGKRRGKDCKEVACLAGHICLWDGYKLVDTALYQKDTDILSPLRADIIAGKLLCLDKLEIYSLFYIEFWPIFFQINYINKINFSSVRLLILKDRVEHFIETGK